MYCLCAYFLEFPSHKTMGKILFGTKMSTLSALVLKTDVFDYVKYTLEKIIPILTVDCTHI